MRIERAREMGARAEEGEAAAAGREAEEAAPDVDAGAAAQAAEEQANELRQRQRAASPHEFVTMEKIIRSGPFTEMVLTVPMVLSLVVALVVDAPRSCALDADTLAVLAGSDAASGPTSSSSDVPSYGKAPPLKAWAITNVVLNCLMFSINALATRIYVKNPSVLFVTETLSHFDLLFSHLHFLCLISLCLLTSLLLVFAKRTTGTTVDVAGT